MSSREVVAEGRQRCRGCRRYKDYAGFDNRGYCPNCTLYERALEHIKLYPCPVCMEESPKELCPLNAAIKELEEHYEVD